MNIRTKQGLRLSVLAAFSSVALVCVAALSGCGSQPPQGASSAEVSHSQIDVLQSKEAVLHVSASSAECTLESLRDDSDLVASGRYLGKSDPILVIPVVGGIDAAMYYTDYYFEVDNVFKGEALTDDAASRGSSVISVRMKGGAGDRVAVVNDDAPELEEGSSYLLFLYRVLDGLDGNTEGNHYYSFGDKLGIWEKDSAGNFANAEVGSVSADSLALMPISDAAPASEQNLASEDAMIDDVRARYNEGQIDKKTLDAYEELYSASRNGFATVGTDDDVRAFEEAMVESLASQSS
ncbi:hypothetical protein [Ellagibacter isourolithinifaciens]|uniref:hypothetical protein n=1 Tax=Ellagibacter isourolithinifaciens TaxID=2137581 RepID=UPI003A8FB159